MLQAGTGDVLGGTVVQAGNGGAAQAAAAQPDGTVVQADGTVVHANGTVIQADGTIIQPDGTVIRTDGTVIRTDGTMVKADGTVVQPAGGNGAAAQPTENAQAAQGTAQTDDKADASGNAPAASGTAVADPAAAAADAAQMQAQDASAAAEAPKGQATGAVTLSGEAVTHVGTDADPNADADAAEENAGISANEAMRGYTNIVLVGIDTRDVNQIDYANSDTMIITSINNETGKIRMASVYRDTLLNIQNSYSMSLGQGDSDEEFLAGEEDDIVYFDEGDYDDGGYDDGGYDDGGYDDGGYDDGGYDDGGYDDGGYDDGGYDDGGNDDGGDTVSYYSEPDSTWTDSSSGSSSTGSRADSGSSGTTSSSGSYSEPDIWVDYTDSTTSSTVSSSDSQAESHSEVFSEPDSGVSEYAGNEYYNYSETGTEPAGQQLGETTAAGKYDKANAAYASGSTRQLLSMLNKNLDLNIHDIVVVDFAAVAKLVDDIDGIDVWMTYQEVVHMNNYCQETSKVTGLPYTPIEPEEMPREYHLNGVQAVSYARIRYTAGNDMKRTQRQRVVINKVVNKAKQRGFDAVNGMINDVFPLCKTSFSTAEIIKLATRVFSFEIEKTTGFPFEHIEKNVYVGDKKLDTVVPVTLEENVKELHEFLFDEKDYECSPTVKEYSNDISVLSGLTIASRDVAIKNSVIEESGGEADVVT